MGSDFEPHPGLRAYPFLAQVCRRWQRILDAPSSQNVLWSEVRRAVSYRKTQMQYGAKIGMLCRLSCTSRALSCNVIVGCGRSTVERCAYCGTDIIALTMQHTVTWRGEVALKCAVRCPSVHGVDGHRLLSMFFSSVIRDLAPAQLSINFGHELVTIVQFSRHTSFASSQLSINFGHELVTSVHTPIAWSDKRPTDEEFRTSFGATRLSSQRLLRFVRRRAHCIRRLVLQNSEGYWCGECVQPPHMQRPRSRTARAFPSPQRAAVGTV